MNLKAVLCFGLVSMLAGCASTLMESTSSSQTSGNEEPIAQVIDRGFAAASQQYEGMLTRLASDKARLPRTFEEGKLHLIGSRDWTSGFFPGSLWLIHEHVRDDKWKTYAAQYTALLEKEKDNRVTHDVGFILFCSYGQGLRIAGDASYRPILLKGAESLSTRFDPRAGVIRSWNHSSDKWKFPVIIDNMMNLELLLWAAKNGGSKQLREIAIKHADTTLKNHFRPDGSSFHVVGYDPEDGGKVVAQHTHQGHAHHSAWARGQAWALYGYTVMYRETKDAKYLDQANKIASFILNHPRLPEDKIPYWDFDAPTIPKAPRDASAGAIIASALLELSDFAAPALATTYRAAAEKQVRSLSSPDYLAKVGENGNFIIMHCVGHMPKNSEVDVPINYGDYYYLEALQRLKTRAAAVAVARR